MERSRTGFTLLELLVVVAIVVVMAALLAPALSYAVYQAELAVCGGNFKGLGTATTVYSSDNKRFYPFRETQGFANQITEDKADDRDVLRTLFPLNKMLNDPLSEKVNLESPKPRHLIFSSQDLFFGYKFEGNRGIRKMGDRLEWNDLSFSIIAADFDRIESGTEAKASHPDKTGRMVPLPFSEVETENEMGLILPAGLGGPTGVNGYLTSTYWIDFDDWRRGPVDLHYAFGDGSVRRYNDVTYDDPRMWVVPAEPFNNNWPAEGGTSTNGYYTLLPK